MFDCSPARLFCPWDFPGKNTGVGLPFPSPGDLLNPGIKLVSPALPGRFFTTEPSGKSSFRFTSGLSYQKIFSI